MATKSGNKTLRHVWAVAAALFCVAASPAFTTGNAENGLKIARQWCSSCHTVEPQASTSDKAPPFAVIAQRRDDKWVDAWLDAPHPPMEGITLSSSQIKDVKAYLRSLAKR
jgi:mono/diheme cytochrome c family protein